MITSIFKLSVRISFFLCAIFFANVFAAATVTRLVPNISLIDWYKSQAMPQYAPTDRFGIYVMQAAGKDLYLGFGASSPTAIPGGLLATLQKVDTGYQLISIGKTQDDGINDFDYSHFDSTLYISSTDPPGDNGGIYLYTKGGSLIRRATQPFVFHNLGMWVDKDTIYSAVNQIVSNVWAARIIKSTDKGMTWTTLSTTSDVHSWAFDVFGHNGLFYATGMSSGGVNFILLSQDSCKTWTPLATTYTSNYQRLFNFKDRVVFYEKSSATTWAGKLHFFKGNDDRAYDLASPYRFLTTSSWNSAVNCNDEYLYWISAASGGMVLRFQPQDNGQLFCDTVTILTQLPGWETQESAATLALWPEDSSLIVATVGTNGDSSKGSKAKLWRIKIDERSLGIAQKSESQAQEMVVTPNPFNPTVKIALKGPALSGKNALLKLAIYDINGRLIKEMTINTQSASNEFIWNAEKTCSGFYFATLQIGGKTLKKKLTLMK